MGAKTRHFPLLFRIQGRAAAGATNPMNTTPESHLLELYDRVAEAPDAIERLRKYVLDLAVRAKVEERGLADESADKLLKRIAEEKLNVELLFHVPDYSIFSAIEKGK